MKSKKVLSYNSSRSLGELTHLKGHKEVIKMSTKRLLSYYKSERKRRISYNEYFYCYDHTYDYELNKKYEYVIDILKEWDLYLYGIKRHLSERENIK